jgi:hypothetical protein
MAGTQDISSAGKSPTQALSRRSFFKIGGLAALSVGLIGKLGIFEARSARASGTLDDDPRLHVLNRVTWGARPDDILMIDKLGIEGYIDWQLDYESIPDPAVDEFVTNTFYLTASPQEINEALRKQYYDEVYYAVLWGRLFRAAYSERQLYERVVEFWTDHFNVALGDYVAEKLIDDREVIRKHALGMFRDMVFASATSPAMLIYLDQQYSDKEHPNENYARELMELHTLGVNGGYTEQDVVDVARAFTGWTLRDGYTGMFFDPNMHDTDEKTVLGHVLPAGRGIEDGLQVIDILVNHPATARHIAFKLSRRFIADTPPDSIVDSAAAVFTETGGNIRAVVRHILLSQEFMASVGQKFRRPMEFIVAAIRALRSGLTIEDGSPFVWGLEPMGHMPFHWNPPDGYPDVREAWMNANGLMQRWNAAMLLPLAADGWIDGVELNLDALIPPVKTAEELVDAATALILGGNVSPEDRETFIRFMSPDGVFEDWMRADRLPALLGLLMASPYFQWH